MAYYAITATGVKRAMTRQQLNKKLKGKLDTAEFKFVGKDAIVQLTESDLEFVQDKARIAQIPVQQLYKKDVTKLILYFVVVLQLIILIRGG